MAKNGFDYSEFLKLTRQTAKLQRDFTTWLNDFLLTEALRSLRLVRPLTPVKTGNLRRLWSISRVERTGNNLTVFLINVAEYASFMEEGFTIHSASGDRWWEGFHMAEISITKIANALPARFDRQFRGWIKQYGWE